ncbi:MAG TPA: hypothetical protein PKC06_14140 [Saprospiraceae bacterium]|jgi:hypothetical protein|nr:hypothetical protein [Saprospiraceae bacterium]
MFNFFKKNKENKSDEQKPRLNFTDRLEMVKYFEFTDQDDKHELIKTIQEIYSKNGTFSTTTKNGESTCNKLFLCDTESLFEEGGYKSQLVKMKHGIEKVADFNNILKSIPDSFDYDSNPNSNWNDAVVDFTKRINFILETSNIEYKIYPANGGNEGYMYLLNQEQYNILNNHVDDRKLRPNDIVSWNSIYNTTQEEYRKYIERDEFKFKPGMSITLKNHGNVQVIKVLSDKSAEIQIGEKVAQIEVITGKYKITFKDNEAIPSHPKERNFVKPEFLKEGMKIKHLKHGKGKILEISEKGVANIKFDDGDKQIILQFAKIEMDE